MLKLSTKRTEQTIILTMLPEGKHVRSAFLSPSSGIIDAGLSDKLILDCSTIDTKSFVEIRGALKIRYSSVAFYDAPVSGGSIVAEKGTLTFMVGVSKENPNFTSIHSVLQTMGTNIVACGGPSFGLTAKLCNNYCSALFALATSEAYNIAIRLGMDPRVFKDVLSSSTGQNCISDKWNPVPGLVPAAPASHGYKPGFKVQLMAKDFGLAVNTAKEAGAKIVLGEPGLEAYISAAQDPACMDLDSRVIYRYIGGAENWDEQKQEHVQSFIAENSLH